MAMATLGGLAQAARVGTLENPPAERLWRPAPPPRYGAWPKDFAAQQRRDFIADRRAADATAAAGWADLSAGGVLPTVPAASTGPTGGSPLPPFLPPFSTSVSNAEEEEGPRDPNPDRNPFLKTTVAEAAAFATKRALALRPELFPKGRALRGGGSLTKVVRSIQDVERLEQRAVNVGAHMSDVAFPSVFAGDEDGGGSGGSGGSSSRDERFESGAVAERDQLSAGAEIDAVPESLQRMLRPDATGGPGSKERRMKKEFDSVVWRLQNLKK